MPELGRIAYEAYGDARNWQTFAGESMPTWDEQDPGLKDAWNAAAEAVAKEIS